MVARLERLGYQVDVKPQPVLPTRAAPKQGDRELISSDTAIEANSQIHQSSLQGEFS